MVMRSSQQVRDHVLDRVSFAGKDGRRRDRMEMISFVRTFGPEETVRFSEGDEVVELTRDAALDYLYDSVPDPRERAYLKTERMLLEMERPSPREMGPKPDSAAGRTIAANYGSQLMQAYHEYSARATLDGKTPLKFTAWKAADEVLNPTLHQKARAEAAAALRPGPVTAEFNNKVDSLLAADPQLAHGDAVRLVQGNPPVR